MSSNDERPRPEYGEYATPEEQARAAGVTYVPPKPVQQHPVTHSPVSHGPVPPPPRPEQRQDGPVPPGLATPTPETEARETEVPEFSRGRFIDRMITNGLIIIAVISFINSFGTYVDFANALSAVAKGYGITDFAPAADADVLGRWILVINVALIAASIVCSVLLARRRVLTFWVPIAGALLFGVAQVLLFTAAAPGLAGQLSDRLLGM